MMTLNAGHYIVEALESLIVTRRAAIGAGGASHVVQVLDQASIAQLNGLPIGICTLEQTLEALDPFQSVDLSGAEGDDVAG